MKSIIQFLFLQSKNIARAAENFKLVSQTFRKALEGAYFFVKKNDESSILKIFEISKISETFKNGVKIGLFLIFVSFEIAKKKYGQDRDCTWKPG